MDTWLRTCIPYDTTYYIQDVLNEVYDEINHFIECTPELECEYEESTLKGKLYEFIFQTYVKQTYVNVKQTYVNVKQQKEVFIPYDEDLYEYFSLKFSQDIIDIFIQMKEITRRYNLDLFHGSTDISLDLEYFLFDYLLIEDPYYNDEENNLENIIDESYV
jgi:hypothetical protein